MNGGRDCGVLWNPQHEAMPSIVQGVPADAYHYDFVNFGAACGTQDDFDTLCLPWKHSICSDPSFKDAFDAARDACRLRWDVVRDLSHCFPLPCPSFDHHALISSQRPRYSKRRGLRVCFADQIEVFLGSDNDSHWPCIPVKHNWIQNWPCKPWSIRRIAKVFQPSKFDPNDLEWGAASFFTPEVSTLISNHFHGTDYLEPLSSGAVLSRFSDAGSGFDLVSLMQKPFVTPLVDQKQDDLLPNEAAIVSAIHQGRAVGEDPIPDVDLPDDPTSGSSSSSSSGRFELDETPISTDVRQDVILFHLRDDPLRVFS